MVKPLNKPEFTITHSGIGRGNTSAANDFSFAQQFLLFGHDQLFEARLINLGQFTDFFLKHFDYFAKNFRNCLQTHQFLQFGGSL
jgi:hypothetical protein